MRNRAASWCHPLVASFVAVVLTACVAGGGDRSTGQFIDDGSITARVKMALVDAEDVDAGDVKVETYQGVVQLSGFVDSNEEKGRAEKIAKGVEGVRSVKNDLRVKGSGSGGF